jgi:hypothetical protein
MTFSEVYERILALCISVADGRALSNGGWHSAALSQVLNQTEDQIDHSTDTWGSLMVWTMYQVFHEQARELHETGSDTLRPRAADRKLIEEKYFENLHGREWSEELAAYCRS